MNISQPSLVNIPNEFCNSPEDSNFDFIGNTSYYDDHNFVDFSVNHVNNVLILSMNCQSLRCKYDELLLMLELYNSGNGSGIAVICLQETWLSDGPDPLIRIPNYYCEMKGYSVSSHGGLVTYVRSDLIYNIVSL